jgi:hypothetical protein
LHPPERLIVRMTFQHTRIEVKIFTAEAALLNKMPRSASKTNMSKPWTYLKDMSIKSNFMDTSANHVDGIDRCLLLSEPVKIQKNP